VKSSVHYFAALELQTYGSQRAFDDIEAAQRGGMVRNRFSPPMMNVKNRRSSAVTVRAVSPASAVIHQTTRGTGTDTFPGFFEADTHGCGSCLKPKTRNRALSPPPKGAHLLFESVLDMVPVPLFP